MRIKNHIKTWVSKNQQKRLDDATILSPLLKIFAVPMTTRLRTIFMQCRPGPPMLKVFAQRQN